MRFLSILCLLAACKGTQTVPTEADADTDTDADTDADADADTDTDTDADTDTDPVLPSDSYTDGTWTTTVEVQAATTLERTYTFATDHVQRDSGPTRLTVVELSDQPVLRSGSLIFDGLFALAVQEARDNSVSSVTDGAFDNGNPVPCDCFETGELWTWVWTRDTAYAADLGLSWLDPARAAASLRFKLSRPKAGGDLRIVQDTGSGGSWPVSTDRAIWALGAQATLDTLDGAARDSFLDDALQAVSTTADEDRMYVYDSTDGLYRGEQSFLDWREQTYSSWTSTDLVPIAESKALSTNLAHWILLDAASRWSDERGNLVARDLYRGHADALAVSIETVFWKTDRWSTLTGPSLDPSVPDRRDMLGEALAALTIATPTQASQSLSSYPHGPHGPPVIWPQQPNVPVYHNRAQWPFVTAYAVRAASRQHNADVFQAGADELIRGAALNLSNMENAEWTTGEPWFDDGTQSGPTVNSRRQLWSVAAYLSFVADGLFGVRPSADGLTFEPFVTDALRTEWLDDSVTLHRFPWHGQPRDLVLNLPQGTGPYGDATVTETATGFTLDLTTVTAEGGRTDAVLTSSTAPDEPETPVLNGLPAGLELSWSAAAGVRHDVVRDGVTVATDVQSPWTDTSTAGTEDAAWCYALEAQVDGAVSAHSRSACWWGDAAERVQTVDAYRFAAAPGTWSELNGQPHHQDWGAPDHTLTVHFRPDWSGPHGLQWVYANGAGGLTTGITASHKLYSLSDGSSVVASGPVVMPHTGAWDVYQESSLVRVDLQADTTYSLILTDAPNMTDLEAHRAYTGGPGGGPDPYRFVDISALKLLAFDGVDQRVAPNALGFDGVDDLAAFPTTQAVVPGAPQQPWESFALEWDDDFLYVALVAESFEEAFVPFVLYLEADPAGAAVVGSGLEYSAQTPALPFTPTHAITVRRQHDGVDGLGPWSGVWTPNGAAWSQQMRFLEGREVWTAADQHTMALRIPRHQLGDLSEMRVAGHVVRAVLDNEWKDTVPAGHLPWDPTGGTFYTIDLDGDHAATNWSE